MSKREEYTLAGMALLLFGTLRVTRWLLWPLECIYKAMGGRK